MLGNFQNKCSCTAKTAEKKKQPCKGSHVETNRTSAFYYIGPVFHVKINSCANY